MVRVNVRRDVYSHMDRFAPYTAASRNKECPGKVYDHKQCLTSWSEGMDWKFATCAVCMEPPHNAVLLLCSSHNKGCHPYMCATSYLHSNCLNLFKKSYTESLSTDHVALPCHSSSACKKSVSLELPCPQCPLCRGQVKGWTVVEPVREFLNNKKRSCIQDGCSFSGTYSELQKHLEEEHPLTRPHEVDPELEKRWTDFVLERERQDVISMIQSSMPNSVILGDYVLDREEHHGDAIYSNGNYASSVHENFNGFYFDRDASHVPRAHRRRQRQRQRRAHGRWLFGPRPFSFTRFAWNRIYN